MVELWGRFNITLSILCTQQRRDPALVWENAAYKRVEVRAVPVDAQMRQLVRHDVFEAQRRLGAKRAVPLAGVQLPHRVRMSRSDHCGAGTESAAAYFSTSGGIARSSSLRYSESSAARLDCKSASSGALSTSSSPRSTAPIFPVSTLRA